eukprot:356529-Chlamydomonas_euryale.AAC.2
MLKVKERWERPLGVLNDLLRGTGTEETDGEEQQQRREMSEQHVQACWMALRAAFASRTAIMLLPLVVRLSFLLSFHTLASFSLCLLSFHIHS